MTKYEQISERVAARLLRWTRRLVSPQLMLGWLSVELEAQQQGLGDAVITAHNSTYLAPYMREVS